MSAHHHDHGRDHDRDRRADPAKRPLARVGGGVAVIAGLMTATAALLASARDGVEARRQPTSVTLTIAPGSAPRTTASPPTRPPVVTQSSPPPVGVTNPPITLRPTTTVRQTPPWTHTTATLVPPSTQPPATQPATTQPATTQPATTAPTDPGPTTPSGDPTTTDPGPTAPPDTVGGTVADSSTTTIVDQPPPGLPYAGGSPPVLVGMQILAPVPFPATPSGAVGDAPSGSGTEAGLRLAILGATIDCAGMVAVEYQTDAAAVPLADHLLIFHDPAVATVHAVQHLTRQPGTGRFAVQLQLDVEGRDASERLAIAVDIEPDRPDGSLIAAEAPLVTAADCA